MKRIPASFVLGGNTWKVVWSDTLLAEHKCYGITHYDTTTIILQRPSRKLRLEVVRQVFWHEWFHAAYMTNNDLKLSRDEKHVDQMGHLLAQFFNTLTY